MNYMFNKSSITDDHRLAKIKKLAKKNLLDKGEDEVTASAIHFSSTPISRTSSNASSANNKV